MPDKDYEPDGTGTYTNGSTTIEYDTEGEQHVTVNETDTKKKR